LTKDLFSYLSCLYRNKNPTISSEAFRLSNILQNLIIKNLFLSFEKISYLNFYEKEYDSSKEIEIYLNKTFEEIRKQNLAKRSNTFAKSKIKKNSYKDLDSLNIKENSSIRLLKSKLAEKCEDLQTISVSDEISLDSHRTDCEESKSNYKYKISITPLDRMSLTSILRDYFVEFKFQNDSEFIKNLFNGEYFNCLNEQKITRPIKNHYIRRRVCYKLYKVFEKLVSFILIY